MSEISENLRDLIIFQDSNKFEPLLNNIRKTLDAFKISKFHIPISPITFVLVNHRLGIKFGIKIF